MKRIVILAAMGILFAISAFAQAQVEKTVSRHVFTSAIVDREPIDTITAITPDEATSVYYFTELNNMQNTTARHVWTKNDAILYEMPVTVNGARWRTFSSMRTIQFTAGDDVLVEVIGEDGHVYATDTLTIQ